MACLDFACQCVTGTFLQDNECVPGKKQTQTKKPNKSILHLSHSMTIIKMIDFYGDICLVFALFLSAQVFPGQLHLNDQTFQREMSNRSSAEFKNKSAEIEREVSYEFIDIYDRPFNVDQRAS